MSNILNILTDITSAILDHAFDLCLESVDKWKSCLEYLSVCRTWRIIGVPKLYKHAIIQYPPRMSMDGIVTNIQLIINNGHLSLVKNVIIHTTGMLYFQSSLGIIYRWIYEDLTHLVGRAQIMNSLTHLGVEVPPPIIGMIIEQLLRAMPNVCILLIREMSDIYDELLPEVHSYSVIGYPNTRRPANACQIYVQIHSFNRINLNLPEDDAVVWRMSPGHLQLLEQIVVPYDHIRSLSSQIVSGYGNPCVFVQFILYYPDQLFINSTGELEWYEMYRILDNDALGFESDTPR